MKDLFTPLPPMNGGFRKSFAHGCAALLRAHIHAALLIVILALLAVSCAPPLVAQEAAAAVAVTIEPTILISAPQPVEILNPPGEEFGPWVIFQVEGNVTSALFYAAVTELQGDITEFVLPINEPRGVNIEFDDCHPVAGTTWQEYTGPDEYGGITGLRTSEVEIATDNGGGFTDGAHQTGRVARLNPGYLTTFFPPQDVYRGWIVLYASATNF